MNIKPKTKPRWNQPRKLLCKWLVDLARWVEPRSDEVSAFYMQQMTDMLIYGQSITRIAPEDFIHEIKPDENLSVRKSWNGV